MSDKISGVCIIQEQEVELTASGSMVHVKVLM